MAILSSAAFYRLTLIFQDLSRGSVNNYLLATTRWLGPLIYLRVWHDNSGKGNNASWHLDRIVIKDLRTNKLLVYVKSLYIFISQCVFVCVCVCVCV